MTRRHGRAVALVAAVYGYFLIYAEFAFIELARPVTGDGAGLRVVMGALGAGGVAGSLIAARATARLSHWLLGCALAAVASLIAVRCGIAALAVAGASIGLSLGGATVALATGLRAMVGGRGLGLVIGLGTGAAYAACNVPWVFESSPTDQAVAAAVIATLAAGLARRGTHEPARPERIAADIRPVWPWVIVFLALVWMDSAAFYIIQHTETLKVATWHGAWTLWGNAVVHLGAAVVAGLILDRARAGALTMAATACLAGACAWITSAGAELAYVTGVSLYSVALVFVAASTSRASATAWIFALSGWVGSALGIGMAQDMHGIPVWFGPAALALVITALLFQRRAGAVLVAGAVVATLGPTDGQAAETADPAIVRGREVYVAEGCIHCHSQYVRAGTEDVVRWGPVVSLDELFKQRPPLPGNRRQGPDLLNVGNRRTPEWNRLHLIDPRSISPDSRMPSYAYLFDAKDTRGEDLVAYLASLGAGTETERAAISAAWKPAATAKIDAAAGAVWFSRLCVQCHGSDAKGDGPNAARLIARPADLTRAEMDRDENRLVHLIKFGRPGTAMAGHETLTDDAAVSLARYVAGLQAVGANHESPDRRR